MKDLHDRYAPLVHETAVTVFAEQKRAPAEDLSATEATNMPRLTALKTTASRGFTMRLFHAGDRPPSSVRNEMFVASGVPLYLKLRQE